MNVDVKSKEALVGKKRFPKEWRSGARVLPCTSSGANYVHTVNAS